MKLSTSKLGWIIAVMLFSVCGLSAGGHLADTYQLLRDTPSGPLKGFLHDNSDGTFSPGVFNLAGASKASSTYPAATDKSQVVSLRDGFDATNNRLRSEEAECVSGTVVTANGTVSGIPGTGDLVSVTVSNKSAANTLVVNIYDGSNNSGKMLDSFSLPITWSQAHQLPLIPYSSGNIYVELVGTSPSANVIVCVKAAQAAN